MNFFLDENFPKTAVGLLTQLKHVVFDIRSTEAEGADDEVIFMMAQDKRAIFLTTDKDFYHTIPFRYRNHNGIVIILLRQPNRSKILSKLDYFLNHFDLEEMTSKVVLLKDNAIAVFRR